jgi:hypothetical protein
MERVASPEGAYDGGSDDSFTASLLQTALRANWILLFREFIPVLTSIYIYGIVVHLDFSCILIPLQATVILA